MSEYAVTDPRTGDLVRLYNDDTDERVASAVGMAHSAYTTWGRTTSVGERAALLRRVAELHIERREELARIMSMEMGKTHASALGEVDFSAAIYSYYADHA